MATQDNSLAGVRVLVVEDEFLIADDLARALRRCGAEPVGPVGTLADAERMIRDDRPDAAILDLNLHGQDASGIVRELTAREVPCLIVSGYSEGSFPDQLKDLPSLEKPVPYDRLTQKLAEVLDARTAATQR